MPVVTKVTLGDLVHRLAESYETEAPQVAEAEERLGIELPAALKELYHRSQGNSLPIHRVYIPLVHLDKIHEDEHCLNPFYGYNWIVNAEWLKSMDDLRKGSTWGDEEPFWPENLDKLIILNARDGIWTFLDYRATNQPRVCVIAQLDENWEQRCHQFSDFEEFVNSLVRVKWD